MKNLKKSLLMILLLVVAFTCLGAVKVQAAEITGSVKVQEIYTDSVKDTVGSYIVTPDGTAEFTEGSYGINAYYDFYDSQPASDGCEAVALFGIGGLQISGGTVSLKVITDIPADYTSAHGFMEGTPIPVNIVNGKLNIEISGVQNPSVDIIIHFSKGSSSNKTENSTDEIENSTDKTENPTDQSEKFTCHSTNMDLEVSGDITDGAVITANKVAGFENMVYATNDYVAKAFAGQDANIIFTKDIKIENGTFNGKLKLTFTVDKVHEGKTFVVAHQSSVNGMEYFTGTIKNQKAEIEVGDLSPFTLAVLTQRVASTGVSTGSNSATASGATSVLDKEPKAGESSFLLPVSLLTIISLGVAIITKK